MDPASINVPPMKDLTIENITENTILINSQSSDQRVTYVMERLVTHLHDFARETRLSTTEWMAALNFLVRVGQISSDVRHVSLPSSLCFLRSRLLTLQVGIHSSFRYPRALPPGRRDRSPETSCEHRRLGPWSFPHPRSRDNGEWRSYVP
jgi:hypothetical protein